MAATDLLARLEKEIDLLHVNLGRANDIVSNVESYNRFVYVVTSMIRTERSRQAIEARDPRRSRSHDLVEFDSRQSQAIAHILEVYEDKERFMEGLPIVEQREIAHEENVKELVGTLDHVAYTQSYRMEKIGDRTR